jgi:hypothetical protein
LIGGIVSRRNNFSIDRQVIFKRNDPEPGTFILEKFYHAFNPNSEIEKGARPPRALFSAPSRKTVGRSKKFQTSRLDGVVQSAGREARPATPVAGVLPNFGIRV